MLRPAARLEHPRALRVRQLHVSLDPVARRLLDHRRDVDAEALRLVDEQCLDRAVQALEQRVGDPLVDERAGRRAALLAGKAERAVGERGDGVVEIGVGVDDHAVLAAHLGHDALEVALAGRELRRGAQDLEADRAGAGERDRVHARMGDQARADVALAGE